MACTRTDAILCQIRCVPTAIGCGHTYPLCVTTDEYYFALYVDSHSYGDHNIQLQEISQIYYRVHVHHVIRPHPHFMSGTHVRNTRR